MATSAQPITGRCGKDGFPVFDMPLSNEEAGKVASLRQRLAQAKIDMKNDNSTRQARLKTDAMKEVSKQRFEAAVQRHADVMKEAMDLWIDCSSKQSQRVTGSTGSASVAITHINLTPETVSSMISRAAQIAVQGCLQQQQQQIQLQLQEQQQQPQLALQNGEVTSTKELAARKLAEDPDDETRELAVKHLLATDDGSLRKEAIEELKQEDDVIEMAKEEYKDENQDELQEMAVERMTEDLDDEAMVDDMLEKVAEKWPENLAVVAGQLTDMDAVDMLVGKLAHRVPNKLRHAANEVKAAKKARVAK